MNGTSRVRTMAEHVNMDTARHIAAASTWRSGMIGNWSKETRLARRSSTSTVDVPSRSVIGSWKENCTLRSLISTHPKGTSRSVFLY